MSGAGQTSAVRLVAGEVVQRQALLCSEKMGRLGDKVETIEKTVAALSDTVESQSTLQTEQITALVVEVAGLKAAIKQRWQFFPRLAVVVSALSALASIIVLIVTLFR